MHQPEFKRRYTKKINKLLAEIDNLNTEAQIKTRSLLETARVKTRKNLENAVPGTWKRFHLETLMDAAEQAIREFDGIYKNTLNGFEKKSFELGVKLIDEPLEALNIAFVKPEIDISVLQFAQAGTADLVGKGLNQKMISDINTVLQLGLTGQRSPFAMMQNITGKLDSSSIFGTTFRRAEVITRTEIARTLNLGSDLELTELSKQIRGLKKQWFWSGKSRPAHASAHGQIKRKDQKFDVGGEKLKHPLDPAGSAKNTVNCGCTVVAFMEGFPGIEEINPGISMKAEGITKKSKKKESEK